MNAFWKKYGCSKCDSYKLLVLEAGCYGSDTKTAYQSYITKNKVLYPAPWHQEGGLAIGRALGSPMGGNIHYLIKTDKSFKLDPTDAEINTAGGNIQHVCATSIGDNATVGKARGAVALCNVSRNGFALNVQTEGLYSIAFYSANGQLKARVAPRHFTAGSHRVGLALNTGLYLADINGGEKTTREKVLVK